MKLTVNFLAALAAALLLASAASAKGLAKTHVCGADACVAIGDTNAAVMSLVSPGSLSQPPPVAGYYRLDFTFGDPNQRVGSAAAFEREHGARDRRFHAQPAALPPRPGRQTPHRHRPGGRGNPHPHHHVSPPGRGPRA